MKMFFLSLSAGLFLSVTALAQNEIASNGSTATLAPSPTLRAAEVIQKGIDLAKATHKNVLVIFTATWCHWCHRMDTLLNSGDVKNYFQDAYVICHVDVQEEAAKKNLENQGWKTYLQEFGGDENEGVPFWAILDDQGKALVNSRIKPTGPSAEPRGDNAGCPMYDKEVAYFIQCLAQTSSMTKDQLSRIGEAFKNGVVDAQ
jgi:thioredoxin-related protein